MNIAIDFDDTLTRDAALWIAFISAAKALEHRCMCVTARRDTAENIDIVDEWLRENRIELPVYFTSLGSKVEYMKKLGIKVDIWIDDSPRQCALGH
jgi:5'(3')-deoxyribonucleotidase